MNNPKNTTPTTSNFYRDKPIFGLDIGYSTIKVMQIDSTDGKPVIIGYGVNNYDSQGIENGVIVDFEAVAEAANELFKTKLVGTINTRRVCLTVPASKTFSRVIKLPRLSSKELAEAVRTEAEQYIPVPIDELYIDYDPISKTDKEIELLAVAIPKKLVDSYMVLSRMLGLEAVAIESTISSAARLFLKTNLHDIPTILIDFGAVSTDISIFDHTIIVTGTVSGGGDTFSSQIAKVLNVTKSEADIIKIKYGLDASKKQSEIIAAIKPFLDQLQKEVNRVNRYYEERYGSERKLAQIVTMGGGANMPGLNEYLTNQLRLPVRTSDPWLHFNHAKAEAPDLVERAIYATVSGAALITPQEIFS